MLSVLHAAHGAPVDPEEQHVAALEHRGAGEHLGGELHALAADAGEEDLPLGHVGPAPMARSANATVCATSSSDGIVPRAMASWVCPIVR